MRNPKGENDTTTASGTGANGPTTSENNVDQEAVSDDVLLNMTRGYATHGGFNVEWDADEAGTLQQIERTGSYLFTTEDVASRNLARRLYGMSMREYNVHLQEREKAQLKEEPNRHVFLGIYTIHPYSKFKLGWDIMMSLLVAYTVITVPLELSFVRTEEGVLALFSVGVVLDFIFIVDIVLSFITGVWTENDVLLMESSDTVREYFKGFFFLDLVSVLPIDYFALVDGRDGLVNPTGGTVALRLLRLLRVLRISKILRYMKKYLQGISPIKFYMMHLIIFSLVFLHSNACFWFLISSLSGFPPNSWVVLSGIQHSPTGEQYVWSLYTALSQMLCISYGSFNPARTIEAAFVMYSNGLGSLTYALVVVMFASLVVSENRPGTNYREFIEEMELYMKDSNLSKGLRDRIRTYISRRWPESRKFDEEKLLSSLPRHLYRDVHMESLLSLTKTVPLLANTTEGFLQAFVPALTTELVLEKETIIYEDEPASGLYIIGQGECGLYQGMRKTLNLADGSFFGEVAILWDRREPFTIIAESETYIHFINRETLSRLFTYFPDVEEAMKKVAQQRLRRLNCEHVIMEGSDTGSSAAHGIFTYDLDNLYNNMCGPKKPWEHFEQRKDGDSHPEQTKPA